MSGSASGRTTRRRGLARGRPRRAIGSGYSGEVKPRARDLVGALILTIVLVVLVVFVVSLGAQGA